MKALQQETEQELRRAEATRSGGPDHRSRRDEEEAPRRAARDDELADSPPRPPDESGD